MGKRKQEMGCWRRGAEYSEGLIGELYSGKTGKMKWETGNEGSGKMKSGCEKGTRDWQQERDNGLTGGTGKRGTREQGKGITRGGGGGWVGRNFKNPRRSF